MIKKFYDTYILKHPLKVLALVLIGVCFLGFNATKLEIDASSETLLLDNDKDLQFSREVTKRYYTPDYLIVTYKPNNDLLSDESLNTLKKLTNELKTIENVSSVTSLLNVPLLQSPVQELRKLVDGVRTIENTDIDKNLVKKEFLESELYKNSLVSSDFTTTAIVLNLKDDKKYFELLEKRNSLLSKKRENSASKEDLIQLEKVSIEFKRYRDLQREENHKNIKKAREIIEKYENDGKLFLGGVEMIANDVIGFVKNDLFIYGNTLIFLLIIILWVIFRQFIWILLPLIICTMSVISTAGTLGLFGWEVTVISSNFIALQLIITISIVLHLIVRYRELSLKYKNANQYKLVLNTILSKFNPSFFAIITTIAGFGSLVLSGIQPVKNLGWMMSAGIAISLLISFLVFPAILILTNRINRDLNKKHQSTYMILASNLVEKQGLLIIIVSVLIVAFSLTGTMKLKVENSFINYFKKSTEIYKGMEIIDNKLGGTTPLDIIIKFDAKKEEKSKKQVVADDGFSDFEAEFAESANDEKYWFTKDKMDVITRVHNYLEKNPNIGKVSSLATLLKTGKLLNKGKELDGFTLALLYKELPEEYKDIILSPYINIEYNEARISTRIIDSNPELRRDALIKKLNDELPAIIDNSTVEFRLSNLMILYNNMLQSLFDSQIKTIGFVVIILFLMFFILFRSLLIAFIAILANIVPISIIFGIMGWLSIPLDIMTITIAAISIGIGVDDTIHYIHRFHEEFKKDHNYINSMKRSHQSIGYAMVYTSLVVIIGFSILVLSNLVPTIYFGLLTVIVMATILLSALFLLPRLLIIFKPYGIKKSLHV
ncbi:efflux RND transporter permease subunit [Arcobacter arenosus]|uniref:RND family transporter n=1 Tax=Arcobacter arenosus TaxID=2576037 RepID=A0A5R8Y3A5_9BACT|nr:MMPL family transporter [Arcobacter arenosus]TLP40554.1 RND family transporter [Arcobacter arenosus]